MNINLDRVSDGFQCGCRTEIHPHNLNRGTESSWTISGIWE